MPLRNVRGLLRTQAAISIIPTRNIGLGGDYRKPKPKICHRKELAANAISIPTKRTFGERYQMEDKTEGYGSSRKTGFSSSASSDRLTEEQENEIAGNIYNWWISGKSYKQWYAERFQQLKITLERNRKQHTTSYIMSNININRKEACND